MEPIEYLRGLRRRWRVIVIATMIGAVAAWLTSSALPESDTPDDAGFEASVLILDARPSQFSADARGGTSGMPLETIATVVTLGDVPENAATRLGGHADPDELADTIEATADNDAKILTITATRPTASQAERTAFAFAKALQGYMDDQRRSSIRAQIDSLKEQLDELPEGQNGRGNDSSIRLQLQSQLSALRADLAEPLGLPILDREDAEAVESTGISAPSSRGMQVLIGAVLGLFGGIVIALVLERFDRKIRSWRNTVELVDAPLLAEIPKVRKSHSIVVVDDPTSRGADAFRLLASMLLHDLHEQSAFTAEGNGHGPENATPTIAITSAVRSEGKSFVSANLAAAMGEVGMRTTVISCDLRAPTLHRYFGVPRETGIVDAVESWDGQPGFHRIHRATRVPNVSFISSGSPSSHPASVLASTHFSSILRYAKEAADIVILDTPATLLSGDALAALQQSESVLLVARLGRTSIDAVLRLSETVERLGVRVAGFALNGSKGVSAGWRRASYRVRPEPVAVESTSVPAEPV